MKYLLFLVLLSIHFSVAGQITFEKTYDDTASAGGSVIQQISDSGYIISGTIWNTLRTRPENYIMKINKYGDTVWYKKYKREIGGVRFLKTSSGNDITVLGSDITFDMFPTYIFIQKTDSAGNEYSHKIYNELRTFHINDFYETSDSSLILAGSVLGWFGTEYALIAKLNKFGDTVWTKRYVSPDASIYKETRYSIAEFNDSCFTVLKSDTSNELTLTKLTYSGDTIRAINFSAEFSASKETLGRILYAEDSTILLSSITKNNIVKLYKFDKAGKKIWQKNTLIPPYLGIKQVEVDKLVIYGSHKPSKKPYLVFADTAGNIISQKTYGVLPGDFSSMCRTLDNGYAFTGYQAISSSPYKTAIFIVKTDSMGNVVKKTSPVAVETLNKGQDIIIYPNPNKGNFQIILPYSNEWELFDISVTDLIGKEIYRKTDCATNSYNINLADQSTGIYYITLKNLEYSITRKVIVD